MDKLVDARRKETIEYLIPAFLVVNQARLTQYAEVLAHGAYVRADHRLQFANTVLAFRQLVKDEQAGRVGQRLDDAAASFVVFADAEFQGGSFLGYFAK